MSNSIEQAIKENQGKISFKHFMQMALYEPGLGYYRVGTQKFGEGGDFITAPEISPLFSYCIANWCHKRLKPNQSILEFGAGTGVMAADILIKLESLNHLPKQYCILEVSGELKARQQTRIQERCPHLASRVIWLERLPTNFAGLMIANEVLDSMPVNRFYLDEHHAQEYYVSLDAKKTFTWHLDKPSTPKLRTWLDDLRNALPDECLNAGYTSEVNLDIPAWIKGLASSLERGHILLIDYGFPRHEYYHPQRNQGTLMCHYQHRAHDNPLVNPGLQDITAHVDFSAVVEAIKVAGLTLDNYSSQARFLFDNGLITMAEALVTETPQQQYAMSQAIKRLTLPSEMGELFKVVECS